MVGSHPGSRGPLSVTEAIFAGWLARRDSGAGESFEELCRAHPEAARDLEALHDPWQRVEALRSADGRSVAERLASRHGSRVDPGIELEPEGEGDSTSKLLSRLSGRGERSGRYRLKGEVARGGMGAVLRVWDEDLRRHLAMKVVLGRGERSAQRGTPEVDRAVLARFLEEAQVTGQLDHPGIVPVHELGLDGEGRVYFTMKLVKGRELKTVFDLVREGQEGWSEVKALGVLVKVCEAMSYAHDKGVIHRDLKPANVMVGRYGEVYVMDWGLARVLSRADDKDIRVRPEAAESVTAIRTDRKAHASDTPDSPLFTMDGDVVGTPAYMPPEQAEGDLAAMGPHSDVYAVGAMLYHLLCGHAPYLREGEKASNYAVWRWVKDGAPAPLTQEAPGAPAELVAICERAMAREIGARYRDMGELGADLSAYLEGGVVAAYETGTWAETRKWVRRNRALAASLAAAVLLLALGLSASLLFKARADRRARDLVVANATIAERGEELAAAVLVAEENARSAQARRQEAEAAQAEALLGKRAAEESAAETRLLADFQSRLLSEISIDELGRTIVLELESDLEESLTHHGFDEAEIAARRSALRTMLSPGNPTNVAQEVLAKAVFAPALTTIEREYAGKPLLGALLQVPLSETLRQLSLYDLGERAARAAVQTLRAGKGDGHADTLTAIDYLARILQAQGRHADAEPLFQESLAGFRALEGRQAEVISSMNGLGTLHQAQGRLADAELVFRDALARSRELFGNENPTTRASIHNLASLLHVRGQYAEAEELYAEVLASRRAALGEDHADTLITTNNFAVLLHDQDKLAEAEELYWRALDASRRKFGDGHSQTLLTMSNLASLLTARGRLPDAEQLLREAVASYRAQQGDRHPDTLSAISNLAQVLKPQGELVEAEALCREALTGRRATLGDRHPSTLVSITNLAGVLLSRGERTECEALAREALSGARAQLGDDHPRTLTLLANLAFLCQSWGEFSEAQALYLELLATRRAKLGDDHAETRETVRKLIDLYQKWHAREPDAGHDAQAAELEALLGR